MREILFRGKRIDNGEWVYGYLVEKIYGSQPVIINNAYMEDDCSIEWEYEHIYPETLGQYTGICDMNGTKIFEGDIVSGGDFDEEDGYGVIDWYDGAFRIFNRHVSATFYDNYYGYEFEVVGNLFDNQELVEVDDG